MAEIYGPVSASPRAHAGPKAAAVEDSGVSLPGELVRAQHAVVLLSDSHHAAQSLLILWMGRPNCSCDCSIETGGMGPVKSSRMPSCQEVEVPEP